MKPFSTYISDMDSSRFSSAVFISPAIIFDTIAGGFLTFGLYQRSGALRSSMPLVRIIIQDGLLYFAVVFVTNIFWLLLHVIKMVSFLFALLLQELTMSVV